ncbi:MAG: TatD family hydrolase [Proteobacteria bacterium]|nr:TatD family hydrolase [Pseudomonadota bacterium]MBU1056838.1 TatD family hydrolase [Pseudomonadota bacterium]
MIKTKKEKPPIPCVANSSFFIDTHCHLDMKDYGEDLDKILIQARAHGVHSIITIGIDEKSSIAAVELARKYPLVKASIGIHPHDVDQIRPDTYQRLKTLAVENKEHIVGYGEIGLDYAKLYAEPGAQKKAFSQQLEIAKELNLPVIIHDRDAHQDILTIIRQSGPFPRGGVMHCFSGDTRLAEQIVSLGFYLSIPGVVTFKNGIELQKVAATVPLESLLLETDGPFLAPVPWRGKRNKPSYLPYTAAKVAELRGISLEEVADQTSRNAQTLFNYEVLP